MADAAAPGAAADLLAPAGEPELPVHAAEDAGTDEGGLSPAADAAGARDEPSAAEEAAAHPDANSPIATADAGEVAGPSPRLGEEAPTAADGAAALGDEVSLLRSEGAPDPDDPADDLLGLEPPPVEADAGEAQEQPLDTEDGGDSPATHGVGDGPALGDTEEGCQDAPDIQQFVVPDAHIDCDLVGASSQGKQESVDRLEAAMESVLTELHSNAGLSEEHSTELAAWREGFQDHLQQLRRLVAQGQAAPADGAAEAVCNAIDSRLRLFGALPQEDDSARGPGAREMARGDEPSEGHPLEEVGSAWADPEEASKEVEDLKRVRRQIRYLFGGMLGSLPDSGGALTVDELIGEDGEVPSGAGPNPVPHIALAPAQLFGNGSAVAGASGYVSAAPAAAEGGPLAAVNALLGPQARASQQAPHLPPRPRSGSTETSALTASSSRMTANSHSSKGKEDEERRRERKERKHRKHRRREDDAEEERGGADAHAAAVGKREDGTAGKPVNWAEEVVRASLDPQNQWEFPAADHGYMGHARAAAGRRGQASWEQPRQAQAFAPRAERRGNDIAMRARERAEQVMRTEREQQLSARNAEKDIFGRGPVAMAGGGGPMGGGFGMAHHSATSAGVPRAW